jgi:TRAP-type C4-dicarboxylate transport system permease small subunit
MKIIGILLIVAGLAGLAYGRFTYTKDTHTAQIGSLELSVKEKKTVDIPFWTSLAAIAAGALVLIAARKT